MNDTKSIMEDQPLPQPQPKPEPIPVRILFSLALGTLTVVLSGALIGLITYFSSRMYIIFELMIGVSISAAILGPLKPISKWIALLLLPAVIAASLASICLGEVLYVILVLIRDSNATLIEAVSSAIQSIAGILIAPDSISSCIFALIGAIGGSFVVANTRLAKE
jgi:hypothetical protein